MNEDVLDVLVYLFENCAMHDADAARAARGDLGDAGFSSDEIDAAFDWIKATRATGHNAIAAPAHANIRVYADREARILDIECQSYIAHLENCGVLSTVSRELVIDRMLALTDRAGEPAEIEQLQWVVMLVLAADGQDAACERLESVIDVESADTRH